VERTLPLLSPVDTDKSGETTVKTLLATTICVLLSASATAENYPAADGNELLHGCSVALRDKASIDPVDNFKNAYCLGLVKGIVDTGSFYEAILACDSRPIKAGLCSPQNIGPHTHLPEFFCLPDNSIPVGQGVRVVVKYLNDHPEKLNKKDSLLVIEALSNVFPCK